MTDANNRKNVLFLFSDEHRRDALGCYGHPLVRTPNLDRLAARGTRFTNAYTPSPICVPARAAMASGEYVHKTRCWSNAQAYHGHPESWGHQLQKAGIRVDSIGKLHYRGKEYDNGFDRELLPMYVKDGVGWIKGLLRDHESVLDCSHYAEEIGPGDNQYSEYDLGVTGAACEWLADPDNTGRDQPWVLFVSWLRPHYPLTCPREFYDWYPPESLEPARFTAPHLIPDHPVLQTLRHNFNYDEYFDGRTRQVARASYYGLCSFLDHQVGRVLGALEKTGQQDNTLIIYSSDHGDHNGDRGLWTKMTMYEESAGIPLIAAGPGIPGNSANSTLASLVDIYPTILQATGTGDDNGDRPGVSLMNLIRERYDERAILSEYHDGGSPTGMFMLRTEQWKYNYYPGFRPELFDLETDPDEIRNIADSTGSRDIVSRCHDRLLEIVDPERENDQAFADQRDLIQKLGGPDAIIGSAEYDFTPVGS